MKRLLLTLCLFTAGCTVIPGPHGKAVFAGDYQNLSYQDGPVSLTASSMRHSVLYDAAGRVIGEIGVSAAETLIANGAAKAVAGGASNGVQLIAATAPSIHHFVNRPTNRPPTTPKPKP